MSDRTRILQRRKHLMWRRKMVNFLSKFDVMWCLQGLRPTRRGGPAVSGRFTCRGCGTVDIETFKKPQCMGLYPMVLGPCKVCLKKVRDKTYPLPKLPKEGEEYA